MILKSSPSLNCETLPGATGPGKRNGISKRVPDVVHPRDLPVGQIDLDDVEPPGDGSGAEPPEPFVRAAFDEPLLFTSYGIVWPDGRAGAAGFHFDEEEEFSVPDDDVDFAATGCPEIAGEDFAAAGAEPCGGGVFSINADPLGIAERPVSGNQRAG